VAIYMSEGTGQVLV